MAFNEGPMALELDETDLNILKLLARDSKMSFAELGKEVHLTAPAVHGRVKRMEKLGVIKHYGVELDFDRLGLPVLAFVRAQIGKTRCRDAGKKIMAFEEVVECHGVAGEDDLLLKTRTATPLGLQNLLDRLKTQGLIERSISIFVLETHFERQRI